MTPPTKKAYSTVLFIIVYNNWSPFSFTAHFLLNSVSVGQIKTVVSCKNLWFSRWVSNIVELQRNKIRVQQDRITGPELNRKQAGCSYDIQNNKHYDYSQTFTVLCSWFKPHVCNITLKAIPKSSCTFWTYTVLASFLMLNIYNKHSMDQGEPPLKL